MLGWALAFFVLAILAGYFGFIGLAGVAATFRQAAVSAVSRFAGDQFCHARRARRSVM